jgi:hypothetical protein
MRADPMDRIVLAGVPAAAPVSAPARVSIPRIFAVGLVLPFAHPIRLLLSSLIPGGIMAWLLFGPYGQAMSAWRQAVMLSATAAPGSYPFATALPPSVFLSAEGLILFAMALWLCAWQRAAVRDFREPTLRWFGASLLRLPGYVLALLVWLLAPFVIVSAATGGVAFAVQRGLQARSGVPATRLLVFDYLGALSRNEWIGAGLGVLLAMLLALWLSARLSTLPPLVAHQGWRHSIGRAWQFSRGHGFGLSLSIIGYSILTFIAVIMVGSALAAIAYRESFSMPNPNDSSTMFAIAVAIDFCVLGLVMLWHASLGALVVRDSRSPAETIDPAMFD